MRKILFILVALLIGKFCFSQTTLPNMDFEDWQKKQYNVLFPNNYYWECLPTTTWATGNPASTTLNIFPTYRTEDAKSGSYAACLETKSIMGQPASGTLFTGWFEPNLMNSVAHFGVPFTGKPDAFQGWYKYTPGTYNNNPDTAAIYAILSRWNGNMRVEIARAEFYPYTNITQYTYFNLPFVYSSPLSPDTISVVFASSKHGEVFQGGIGSKLFIDNINFYYDLTSIESTNIVAKTIEITYNNINRSIIISRSSSNYGELELFDITGKKIKSWKLNNTNADLSVGSLIQGIYICRYTTAGEKPYISKIYIN